MGLLSGEVAALDVLDCTVKYLCSENDQVKQVVLYHPEKAEGFSQDLLDPAFVLHYIFLSPLI
jgi:hypothetical protein